MYKCYTFFYKKKVERNKKGLKIFFYDIIPISVEYTNVEIE